MLTTARFPRGGAAAEQRREAQYLFSHVTVAESPTVLVLDLRDEFIDSGALYQLVVPLAEAIRQRRMGHYALVVATDDDATIEVLRSLSCEHDLPLLVTRDPNQLQAAEPASRMSPAKASVFSAVKHSRMSTVAQVAGSTGVGHTSASNLLADLVSQGYLFRAEGSGRQGHVYIHPASATTEVYGEDEEAGLLEPFARDLDAVAEATGRPREELLAEAWREYLGNHSEILAAAYSQAAEMLRHGDRDGLRRMASASAKERAAGAAERAKR